MYEDRWLRALSKQCLWFNNILPSIGHVQWHLEMLPRAETASDVQGCPLSGHLAPFVLRLAPYCPSGVAVGPDVDLLHVSGCC